MTIRELIEKYVAARAKRLELEAQAREIAQGEEADLQRMILALMAADGISSLKFAGLGRVVRRNKGHYEIADIEKVSLVMLKEMAKAYREGRPLADALILQRRISRENLESLCHDEAMLAEAGVAFVEREELAVTKN